MSITEGTGYPSKNEDWSLGKIVDADGEQSYTSALWDWRFPNVSLNEIEHPSRWNQMLPLICLQIVIQQSSKRMRYDFRFWIG